VDKKDVLYCKLADAKTLFKLEGAVEKNNFVMKPVLAEKKANVDNSAETIDAAQKIDHKAEPVKDSKIVVAEQEIGQAKTDNKMKK
jgi:hypothetical protein